MKESERSKWDRNQMRMAVRRMMVPAFLTKAQALSSTALALVKNEGMWYGGSSMMKGAGVPASDLNFFRMIPDMMTMTIPPK